MKTNEPKQIAYLTLLVKRYTHKNAVLMIKRLNIIMGAINGPTVRHISEQLTKQITNTQQWWHFSKYKNLM